LDLLRRPEEHEHGARPIVVEGVTVRLDGRRALEDVSFRVQAGERVAVVGPNGAGKTTLLQVIAGTREPTSGKVHVYGRGPGGHVCIAYVPQRSQVDWAFPVNVADVVMMGRVRKLGFFHWPKREDWDLVRESLDRVGMAELAHRQIGALSGGQQQRVFLAQALAQGAEIVLLDEPLSGLDLPAQEAIFGILEKLKRERVTVLVATHDLNMAARRFDRVMLLNRELIIYGPPDQVLDSGALERAYGGHLHILDSEEGKLALTDTCCEGEGGGHG
jgi:ABC-type Mn2+/Zn2+ transport system ATPase subunit